MPSQGETPTADQGSAGRACKILLAQWGMAETTINPVSTGILRAIPLRTAETAWDLVVRHQYPMDAVAAQLGVTREQLHYMLLVMAVPWTQEQIN